MPDDTKSRRGGRNQPEPAPELLRVRGVRVGTSLHTPHGWVETKPAGTLITDDQRKYLESINYVIEPAGAPIRTRAQREEELEAQAQRERHLEQQRAAAEQATKDAEEIPMAGDVFDERRRNQAKAERQRERAARDVGESDE